MGNFPWSLQHPNEEVVKVLKEHNLELRDVYDGDQWVWALWNLENEWWDDV